MKLKEGDMLQAGKYLLSCLTEAIDTGLTARYGRVWIDLVRSNEKEEKKPILTDEEDLKDFDIQVCLKLFKFRPEYRDAVLDAFGFYDLGTEEEKKQARNTFTEAVTRLMDNYRNKYMHLSAGVAGTEWSADVDGRSYGVEEAISDMKEVSKYFLKCKDPSGIPYYDRICECEASYSEDKNMRRYLIADELSSKGFKGYTDDDFIRACNELNIPVEKEGAFFYCSSDREEDLKALKRQMSKNRESRADFRRKIAVITGVCVGAAALVAGLLIFAFGGRSAAQPETGISASVFQPAAYEAGSIDPADAEKLLTELKESADKLSFDEYKQFYTSKYREDERLDDYIENEQEWLAGVSDAQNMLFIPVVSAEDALGVSAVFYGKPSEPEYKKARLFTFAEEDGKLKSALEKIMIVSKYTGDYPDAFNSAAAEGRNAKVFDEADRSFREETAVIPDTQTCAPVLAWAEPDGSVSLLLRLANGTESAAGYSSVHVNLTAGDDLLYEGDADLRRNGQPYALELGKGVNFIVNIKKDSLKEGAAGCEWSGLVVRVDAL